MRYLISILIILSFLAGGCGSSPEEFLEKGMAEAQNENYNGAAIYFKNALEKDPDFVEAREQLAISYKKLSKYEKALEEYQQLIKHGNDTPEIQIEIANLLLLNNKFQESIELSSSLAENSSDPGVKGEALLIQGSAYIGLKKLEDAEQIFTRAVEFEGSSNKAYLELARLSVTKGDVQEARERLKKLFEIDPDNVGGYYLLTTLDHEAGNLNDVLKDLNKIIEINPEDQIALYRKGMLLLDLDEEEQARQVGKMLRDRFPNSILSLRYKGIMEYLDGDYDQASIDLVNSLKKGASVEAYYFLGLTAYSNGDPESAISYLRKVLDMNSDYLQARLLISRIFVLQKRYDQALYEATQAVRSAPQNPLAHISLGSAYAVNGDLESSLREFDKALELDPEMLQAHIQKGIVQMGGGNYKNAEASLLQALEAKPDNLRVRLILYQFHMRQRNFDKAIAIMKEGLTGNEQDAVLLNYMASAAQNSGDTNNALGYLDKAIKINPDFLNSFASKAKIYISEQQYEEAEQEYNSLLTKSPDNAGAYFNLAALDLIQGREESAKEFLAKAEKNANPQLFLQIAQTYYNLGMHDQAQLATDKAIEKSPSPLTAQIFKSDLLLSLDKEDQALAILESLEGQHPRLAAIKKIQFFLSKENFKKAMEEAKQLIDRFPHSADGYIYLAQINEQKGDRNAAIQNLVQGVDKDPENLEALLLLGDMRARNGETELAHNTFDTVIKKYPENPQGYYKKGTVFESLKDKDKAIEYYRKALSFDRKNLPALNNLAYLLLHEKESEKQGLAIAIEAYRQAPLDPAITDTLGYALLLNGYKQKAVAALERASKILPDNPSIKYHLGMAYYESGNKEAAQETLNKAMQMGDFEEKHKVRSLLEKIS